MTTTLPRVPRCFLSNQHSRYTDVRSIRQAVLVEEFGIPEVQECTGDEAAAHYLIASGNQGDDTGIWYGTARVIRDARKQHLAIERLALLREFRGHGLGTKLIGWIVDEHVMRSPGYSMSLTVLERDRDNYGGFGFTAEDSQPFPVNDQKYIRLQRPPHCS